MLKAAASYSKTRLALPSMSPSTLLQLPPELICRVFELTNSLQATFALSLTSKAFQQVWHEYRHSIYLTLYPEALQLANLQRDIFAEGIIRSLDDGNYGSTRPLLESQAKQSIIDIVRLNAVTVANAGRAFVQLMRDENPFYFRHNRRGTVGFLKPVERDRFTRAYYSYWIKHVEEQLVMGRPWHGDLDLRALFLVPTLLKPCRSKPKRGVRSSAAA